jgi:hypothetical protein
MTSEKPHDVETPYTTPNNPYTIIEEFLKNYEETVEVAKPAGDNSTDPPTIEKKVIFKYQQRIALAYSQTDPLIPIDLEDILQYDPVLYAYLLEDPKMAFHEFEVVITDLMMASAGGQKDGPEKIRPVFSAPKNDLTLAKHIKDLQSTSKNGTLIQINGIVTLQGKARPRLTEASFECPVCGNIMKELQTDEEDLVVPRECSNSSCRNTRDWKLTQKDLVQVPSQKLYVHDSCLNVNPTENGFPEIMLVEVQDYLINYTKPGDIVAIIGIITLRPRQALNRKKAESCFCDYCLEANSIAVIGTYPYQITSEHDSRVYLIPEKGIFVDKLVQEHPVTQKLYGWTELKIEHRYQVKQGPNSQWRYIGYIRINTTVNSFYDVTFDSLKAKIHSECAVASRSINVANHPLQQYFEQFPDETGLVETRLGFIESGWSLPSNAIILLQEQTGCDLFFLVDKIMKKTFDKAVVIEKFRKIYDLTGIKYKELLFCWGIQAPFAYVIRNITKLMSLLVLQGPGEFGKSPFIEMILCVMFGLKHEKGSSFINSSTVEHLSQFESYIASSTFPVGLDDITHTDAKFLDVLKSYLTLDQYMFKKGAGENKQFASVQKAYLAALALTCNDLPDWFCDPNFVTRTIIFFIDELIERPEWGDAVDSFPVGGLMWLLYEHTKDWTMETIRAKIKSIVMPPVLCKLRKNRKYKTYQIFGFGALLMKEIFNITVDLAPLLPILDQSASYISDDLFSLMQDQILRGRIRESSYLKEGVLTLNGLEAIRQDETTWIKTPLGTATYKDKADNDLLKRGWAWNINNIREIQFQYEGYGKIKWTSKMFQSRLIATFPHTLEGSFNTAYVLNGVKRFKRMRVVVVPFEDWKSFDDADNNLYFSQGEVGLYVTKETENKVSTPQSSNSSKGENNIIVDVINCQAPSGVSNQKIDEIDIMNVATKKRNLLNVVQRKIGDLQLAAPKEGITFEDLWETLSATEGVTPDFIKNALGEWVKDGTLFTPNPGEYKLAHPPRKQ